MVRLRGSANTPLIQTYPRALGLPHRGNPYCASAQNAGEEGAEPHVSCSFLVLNSPPGELTPPLLESSEYGKGREKGLKC